jgi:hypothetical protein
MMNSADMRKPKTNQRERSRVVKNKFPSFLPQMANSQSQDAEVNDDGLFYSGIKSGNIEESLQIQN